MPSGSHGGRGGSHGGFTGGGSRGGFGGGSRSGGSSHRHYGRNHGPVFCHRPRSFIFFGRPIVMTSGRQMLLSISAFFMAITLIMALVFGANASSAKNEKRLIEEEQRYYLEMVNNAESNPDLQVEATVTGVFYQADFGKYYYTYKFGTANYQGYTFSIYTLETKPAKGDVVIIAVDDEVLDSDTDSIPMDYKNFTLEDDGEYLLVQRQVKTSRVGMISCLLLLAGLIGVCVLICATAKRKEEDAKREQQEKEERAEKKKYCQYCGYKLDETDKNCPQCGARIH